MWQAGSTSVSAPRSLWPPAPVLLIHQRRAVAPAARSPHPPLALHLAAPLRDGLSLIPGACHQAAGSWSKAAGSCACIQWNPSSSRAMPGAPSPTCSGPVLARLSSPSRTGSMSSAAQIRWVYASSLTCFCLGSRRLDAAPPPRAPRPRVRLR